MLQAVNEIIESISHAAVDADLWDQVLHRISHHFAGTKVVMQSEDATLNRNIGLIYCGMNDNIMRDYIKHYASINPWVPIFLQMPRLHAATTDKLLPAASFEKSEFYCDFIRSEGSIEHAAGVKIFHESTRVTMLSAHYGNRQAECYNTVLEHTLQLLTPHLRTALEINRRLASGDVVVKSIADIVRTSRSPMGLLDAGARLLLANRSFLDELAGAGPLVAGSGDTVMPRNQRLRPAFDALIRRATSRRTGQSAAPTDAFEMTFGAENGSRVTAAILGMTPHGRAGLPWLSNLQRYALVTVDRPPVPTSLTPSELVSRHGLTPAEARLAVGLSTGLTLSECADRSSITFETARTYLRNIFAKTDTHHQGQLIAMLLSGCPKRVGAARPR